MKNNNISTHTTMARTSMLCVFVMLNDHIKIQYKNRPWAKKETFVYGVQLVVHDFLLFLPPLFLRCFSQFSCRTLVLLFYYFFFFVFVYIIIVVIASFARLARCFGFIFVSIIIILYSLYFFLSFTYIKHHINTTETSFIHVPFVEMQFVCVSV